MNVPTSSLLTLSTHSGLQSGIFLLPSGIGRRKEACTLWLPTFPRPRCLHPQEPLAYLLHSVSTLLGWKLQERRGFYCPLPPFWFTDASQVSRATPGRRWHTFDKWTLNEWRNGWRHSRNGCDDASATSVATSVLLGDCDPFSPGQTTLPPGFEYIFLAIDQMFVPPQFIYWNQCDPWY